MYSQIQRLDVDLYLSIFWLIMGVVLFVVGGYQIITASVASLCLLVSLAYSLVYRWSVGKFLKDKKILLDEDGQYTLYSSQQRNSEGDE